MNGMDLVESPKPQPRRAKGPESPLRRSHFPYGMERNVDGSWTLFNRDYKPVGVMSREHVEWDDPNHKVFFSQLRSDTRKRLQEGDSTDARIYFYDDATCPEKSTANMKAYLEKLGRLMKLQVRCAMQPD